MQKLKVLLLVSFVSFFAGCATLLSGSSAPVTINSSPAGASVTIKSNGVVAYSGMTPFTQKMKKGRDYQIEVSLDGYQTAVAGVGKGGIEPVAFCNVLSIPMWAIDFITGSVYKLEPGVINVTLKEVTAQDGTDKVYAFVTIVGEDGEPVRNMLELSPKL